LAAIAEGAALGAYSFTEFLGSKKEEQKAPLSQISVLSKFSDTNQAKDAVKRAEVIAEQTALVRDLINTPPSHLTPDSFCLRIKKEATKYGVKVEILNELALKKGGYGGIIGVGQGSANPPRLLRVSYTPSKFTKRFAFVGKGITFDTGGISLKPAPEMDEMKYDMGGAASVLGVFHSLSQIKPKINVVGLIPACENMPDGLAVKPGDVVTSMSGQTIEILNTDAEGRLILCDALTYAERFKPKAVIDIATLTGACVIALGAVRSGMFATEDDLAHRLQQAGDDANDLCWRLPLDDAYSEALKSNFADVANVGGRAGGAITAAKFLHRFAKKYPWAHLDIAGTAWKGGAAKGATGRPVGLLLHYLLSQASTATKSPK
jgi:leucyl aminopeptidase